MHPASLPAPLLAWRVSPMPLNRVGRTIEAMPIHWIHEASVLAEVTVCGVAHKTRWDSKESL